MRTGIKKDIKDIQKFCIENNKEEKYMPKKLMIEVTNYCNSKCIFCVNCKMIRKKCFIDENIVKKAIEQGKNMGIQEVGFYTNGEPLLNLNIDRYIEYAKKNSYNYVYITTNGILANEERIRKLFDIGLDSIKFSINSIEKENYNKIHGTDCFEVVVNNLKNIYNMKKKEYKNKRVYVSYIKTKLNNYKDNEINDFFKEYCDDISIQNVRNQGGLVSNIKKLKFNNTREEYKLPCFYPFNTVVITCEGYVTACCMDFQNYLVYGNLNKGKISDIWNNEVIQKLREKHLNGKIDNILCKNCIENKFEKCKPLLRKYASEINFDEWRKYENINGYITK